MPAKRVSVTAMLLLVCSLAPQRGAPAPPPPQPQTTQEQGPPTAPQTPARFRITGVVVNADNGEPLSGAEVRLSPSEAPNPTPNVNFGSMSVATGSDGRFVFDGLAADRYILNARKRGYPATYYLQHENFFSAVAVGPGIELEDIVLPLRPGAVISGRVTDEVTDPVRYAQVMLFRQGLSDGTLGVQFAGQKSTDDLGRYLFSGLGMGTYFVGVSARPWYAQNAEQRAEVRDPLDVAYPVTYFSGAIDPAGASPITLAPGDRTTVDVQLTPLPSIHIRLKRPQGSSREQGFSVVGQQVTMGNHRILLTPMSARVEGDTMDYSGLPPGRFQLEVRQFGRAGGGEPQAVWRREVDTSRSFEVDLGESQSDVSVGGTVKLPGIKPLPGACYVSIQHRETGQAFSGPIRADGGFEIQGALPTGAYDVFLNSCPAYHVARVTSTPEVKTIGRSFELVPGQTARLTVELGSGLGRLDGVVLRGDKPAAGVMLLLAPADGLGGAALIRREQSNTDGTFTLPAIPPGRYIVVAVDNGWNLEWARREVLNSLLAGGKTLQIEANGRYEVTLKLQ